MLAKQTQNWRSVPGPLWSQVGLDVKPVCVNTVLEPSRAGVFVVRDCCLDREGGSIIWEDGVVLVDFLTLSTSNILPLFQFDPSKGRIEGLTQIFGTGESEASTLV